MPLTPGTKLGPYEILSPLGAGGMGEVYRARDTRLDRDVAVKVLLTNLASDPSLKQRLEREAKAVSKLSHPHICTLHDIGHQDGIDFLVMELVEGETLEQRLLKGPLPADQVIRYAAQIADALAKAHKRGFTHRDLKPEHHADQVRRQTDGLRASQAIGPCSSGNCAQRNDRGPEAHQRGQHRRHFPVHGSRATRG